MNDVFSYLATHPGFILFGAWYVYSAFVSSLPAPRAQSTQFYIFTFKFFNTLAGNLSRAKSTTLENSPNFSPAVFEEWFKRNGLQK
jgi:hypothetical protein